MSLIDKLFGTHSERELKKIKPIIDKIEALRPEMQALTDEQLRAKTEEFKKRLANGETLDDILVEAFAVVREGAKRSIGLEPYPVQLIGGVVLHQGRVAEAKTGEGKTLMCVPPAYLNALSGKGVQIVTVNDYLAKRDAELMGQVHEFLGLSCGYIQHNFITALRKEMYHKDITYVTNSELGFDYLKDNMVSSKEEKVLRELDYCIIDEADSVIIDEARTPLIISVSSNESDELYIKCDKLAKQMIRGEDLEEMAHLDVIMGIEQEETGDFILYEKDKNITLTAQGIAKVEKYFNIENLADAENLEIQHGILTALRANNCMFRDKDYIVKDNKIFIVDEFTGRIAEGRRYSDGLHQAIEAKEGVIIKGESKTLATITYQNFFNKYRKKSGMTGTAMTEEQEFREIYDLDVVVIPTNKPVIREDKQDAVFKTRKEKLNAVVEEVAEAHKIGQPVLVGTASIEASEEISELLNKKGIVHNVLNAKQHEREAEIVALAGQHGAVTIATNMAGRGTDIKLDDEAKEAGGLYIIGTERHESRRIDNQLRGRSGRQGDPGKSKFYLSLEDSLLRLFGNNNMLAILNAMGIDDGMEIQHNMLTNAIETAQKKIESYHFTIRKNVLKFDKVNNEQREIIYAERDRVLEGDSIKEHIINMMKDTIDDIIDRHIGEDIASNDDIKAAVKEVRHIIPFSKDNYGYNVFYGREKLFIKNKLFEIAKELYRYKEIEVGNDEVMRQLERMTLLRVVDSLWMQHIDDMEQLRQGIGLQAYGSKDPFIEYQMQGFDMFNDMIDNIKSDTVKSILNTVVRKEAAVEAVPMPVVDDKIEQLENKDKKEK